FGDTKGHWAEAVIDELYAMGIVHGDGNGNFRPDEPVTRAEAAAMVRNTVRYIKGE
ncbi:MAG: S-layer homology domain-containing protein, partial [Clostridia bacterium]